MPVCFCTGNSTLSRNVTNRKYYKKYRKPRRRATARREPRCSYTATIGTVLHIQHRSIQTKVDKVTLTTIEALTPISAQRPTSNTEAYKNKPTRSHIPTTKKFSKKARGVCRGAVALRPLCGFHFSPKKNISSNKQIFFFRLFLNTFIQTLQKI